MLDLRTWLQPVAGDDPSGVDLRGDPRFDEILRLCEPSVETVRDSMNNVVDTTTAAPDWSEVLSRSETLSGDGKDLRLILVAARSMFELDGISGLAHGIQLINTICEEFWDSVYPKLREGQPIEDASRRRLNTLRQIDDRGSGLLGPVSRHVFLIPPGEDPVVGADLAMAMKSTQDISKGLPELASSEERHTALNNHEALIRRVKGACREMSKDQPQKFDELKADVSEAVAALSALEETVTGKLGPHASDFEIKGLGALLRGMDATLKDTDRPEGATLVTDHSSPPTDGPAKTKEAHSAPGEITSREDVVAALDKIISFYKRTEPASPIPHLADRLRRAVHMSFIELLEDLAPGGVKEFRTVAGIDPLDKKGKSS